jgi:hypothetical protein
VLVCQSSTSDNSDDGSLLVDFSNVKVVSVFFRGFQSLTGLKVDQTGSSGTLSAARWANMRLMGTFWSRARNSL